MPPAQPPRGYVVRLLDGDGRCVGFLDWHRCWLTKHVEDAARFPTAHDAQQDVRGRPHLGRRYRAEIWSYGAALGSGATPKEQARP